jgi:hypothetical protein
MFYVKWKLIVAFCFLNLHVEANASGSQKKKTALEIISRQHLPTRNEDFSLEKSEENDDLSKLTENVKDSPKGKIIRKSSKHGDVKSMKVKSQNSDLQPRRNKFNSRQSYYIEVVQGDIIMEQKM